MDIPHLSILISAQDSASMVLGAVGMTMAGLGFSARDSSSKLNELTDAQKAQIIAGGTLIGTGMGVIGMLKDCADSSITFKDSLARLNTILDYTPEKLSQLGNDMQMLDMKTRYSMTDITDAATAMATKGIVNLDELNTALIQAADLAAATRTPLVDAADSLASVTRLFPDMAGKFQEATNIMTKSIDTGLGSVHNFDLALGNVGPRAAEMGVSFKDVAIALDTMTSNGANASSAGTALYQMLDHLIPVTKAAKAEMQAMGWVQLDANNNVVEGSNVFFDEAGNLKDVTSVVQTLRSGFSGLSEEQRIEAERAIFTTRSGKELFALYEGGKNSIEEVTKRFDAQRSAQEKAAQMNNTAAANIEKFTSSLETLKTKIGSGIADAIGALASNAQGVVNSLNSLGMDTLSRWGLIAGIGAACLVIAGTALVVGPFFAGLAASFLAAAPIAGSVAGAVAGIALGVQTIADNKGAQDFFHKLGDDLDRADKAMRELDAHTSVYDKTQKDTSSHGSEFSDTLSGIAEIIVGSLLVPLGVIASTVIGFGHAFTEAGNTIGGFGTLLSAFGIDSGSVADRIGKAFDGMGTMVSGNLDAIEKGFTGFAGTIAIEVSSIVEGLTGKKGMTEAMKNVVQQWDDAYGQARTGITQFGKDAGEAISKFGSVVDTTSKSISLSIQDEVNSFLYGSAQVTLIEDDKKLKLINETLDETAQRKAILESQVEILSNLYKNETDEGKKQALLKKIGVLNEQIQECDDTTTQAIKQKQQIVAEMNKAKEESTNSANGMSKGIVGVFQGMGAFIGSSMSDLGTKVSVGFEYVKTVTSLKLNETRNTVTTWVSNIGSAFSSIGNNIITAITGALMGLGSALLGVLQDAVNYAFNNLSIPNPVSWVQSHLPQTASGGIVTSAQARVVGEAGPEAIIPLDRLESMMTKLANAVSNSSNRGGDTHVYIDGQEIYARVENEYAGMMALNGGNRYWHTQ